MNWNRDRPHPDLADRLQGLPPPLPGAQRRRHALRHHQARRWSRGTSSPAQLQELRIASSGGLVDYQGPALPVDQQPLLTPNAGFWQRCCAWFASASQYNSARRQRHRALPDGECPQRAGGFAPQKIEEQEPKHSRLASQLASPSLLPSPPAHAQPRLAQHHQPPYHQDGYGATNPVDQWGSTRRLQLQCHHGACWPATRLPSWPWLTHCQPLLRRRLLLGPVGLVQQRLIANAMPCAGANIGVLWNGIFTEAESIKKVHPTPAAGAPATRSMKI